MTSVRTLFNSINSAAHIGSAQHRHCQQQPGSGNFDVTIKDTGKLTINDYKVTFTSATDYTVQRLPDNTAMGSVQHAGPRRAPVIDGFS